MKATDLFNELNNEFQEYCKMQGELWDGFSCEVESIDFSKQVICGKLTICENYSDNTTKRLVWNVEIQRVNDGDYEYNVETYSGHMVYSMNGMETVVPIEGLN